tara:strand:+ start:152 stop:385 length:234 start_codon:yes stop_codon:yes gene_type:complete
MEEFKMRRITSTILEGRLKELNDATNSSFKLDHNSNYGGYSITIPVSGSHLVGRMPAREMYTYLQGALDWVTRPSFK